MVIFFFFMLSSVETKIYPAHTCKMPTIIGGILTFISRIHWHLQSKPETIYLNYFSIYEHFEFHVQMS